MLPAYRSAMYLIEPRILQSSRDNAPGPDITRHITHASVDADIDRAGPKGRLELAASTPGVLPANAWIAPYLDIVPETGEPASAQMGLYQLGEPRVTWDGIGGGFAEAAGEDIIALLDRATLTEAQTSGRSTNVMEEVRYALELATMTTAGPDILTNGDFAGGLTGWNTGSDGSGFVGSDGVITSVSYPSQKRAWSARFDPACPVGGYRWLQSTAHPIPPNTRRMCLSLWLFANAGIETRIGLRFPGSSREFVLPAYAVPAHVGRWHRAWIIVDVPDDATTVHVLIYGRLASATGTDIRYYVDTVHLVPVLGTPLTRRALPEDRRNATTVISHPAGTRWLERINDLLTAIGYHALTATPDGRATSRPQRDPRTDTPARAYTLGADSRVTGEVITEQSRTNLYNRVVAIKEDFQTGTALVAVASNDDPDHKWSTVNLGPIAPPEPLVVSDAVDQAALQALAEAKLARATMQESVGLSLLPDPTLGVHDVIELAGTTGPAAGRWAIESIRWGLTADDPLITVGARRVITTTEASNE